MFLIVRMKKTMHRKTVKAARLLLFALNFQPNKFKTNGQLHGERLKEFISRMVTCTWVFNNRVKFVGISSSGHDVPACS